MNTTRPRRRQQSGVFMLEALISVVIFAIGLIALVGVSAQAVNMVGQSKARNDASYLAGELIGEMWVSASTPTDFLAGAEYAAWLARVKDPLNLPGGDAVVVAGAGNPRAFPPVPVAVSITITWIDKKDPGAPPHQYQTNATITH